MGATLAVLTGTVVVLAGPLSHADSGPPHPAAHRHASPSSPREQMQSMLLKYAARCALGAAQSLEAAGVDTGTPLSFPGGMGLAPEWRDGTCGPDCQEKVSACLMALSNRTGRHVRLSALSADATMGAELQPTESDLPYTYQEGAFFGNVFLGEGYACRGAEADKGEQVKRFCALDPESCDGLVPLRAAGTCANVCEMECHTLSDGSARCAAASCRDPQGRVWRHPLTTYLRGDIEAGNADRVRGLRRDGEALDGLDRGGLACFERVNFGRPGRAPASAVALTLAARNPGRLEISLDGAHFLGAVEVAPAAGAERIVSVPIRAASVSGPHTLVLKVVRGHDVGRLSAVALLPAPTSTVSREPGPR